MYNVQSTQESKGEAIMLKRTIKTLELEEAIMFNCPAGSGSPDW